MFYVLNAEQHAIWLTEQLSKWHRQSLEVRDREMQLYETNKQLRALAPDELDQPEIRRRIENQAAAERTNGRRLANLVGTGEDLVQQAMRNPEFGVGHLEKWAEMLQILKDIAATGCPRWPTCSSRRPSLRWRPQAPSATRRRWLEWSATRDPARGRRSLLTPRRPRPRFLRSSTGSRRSSRRTRTPVNRLPPRPRASLDWRLPETTLAGKNGDGKQSCPTGQKVEEAVAKQQDLLAEFEKIADELNRVLANLEGSTLVKRLKAASRMQYSIAGRMIDQVRRRLRSVGCPRAPTAPRRSSASWRSKRRKEATTSR